MKRMILMCCLLATFMLLQAQTNPEANNTDTASWAKKNAANWYKKLDWLSGLKIKPHGSVNQKEFEHQYHLHKQRWDKAFAYLKRTDLSSLEPGRFSIDGDDVYAIVTASASKDFSQTKWEAHHNYADIHYMISGEEKIGVAPLMVPLLLRLMTPQRILLFTMPPGKSIWPTRVFSLFSFPSLTRTVPVLKCLNQLRKRK